MLSDEQVKAHLTEISDENKSLVENHCKAICDMMTGRAIPAERFTDFAHENLVGAAMLAKQLGNEPLEVIYGTLVTSVRIMGFAVIMGIAMHGFPSAESIRTLDEQRKGLQESLNPETVKH